MSTVDKMTCMSCGRTRQYPDGFPVRHFAECWECAWSGHIHASHRRIVRKVTREVKKRARLRATKDLMAVALESEKRIMLGLPSRMTTTKGDA